MKMLPTSWFLYKYKTKNKNQYDAYELDLNPPKWFCHLVSPKPKKMLC